MARIVVSLTWAALWLAAGLLIVLGYLDLPWQGTWIAFLMCAYNLVKAWVQLRAHKRRVAARGAVQRPYREGEPPPVRRRL
jgi:hypothetical protein